MLDELAVKTRKASEEITRLLGDLAAEFAGAGHVYASDEERLKSHIERLEADLKKEREARETAQRMGERFRYALWVYLQERDGSAGTHAPTPETLKLIRELIKELE